MEHLSIRQGLCVRYFDEDEITIDQFFDSVSSKNDTSLQPFFHFLRVLDVDIPHTHKFTRVICVFFIYYLQVKAELVPIEYTHKVKTKRKR